MIYASTFLSYRSKDEELVEAVARELGQRGILVWLDKKELRAGISLTEALTEAVNHQATLTVFLSNEAVKSGWVERELRVAFEKEKEPDNQWRILPVFLDDPETLVQASPLLRERWPVEAGRQVNVKGVVSIKGRKKLAERAKEIAGQIACAIYRALEIQRKDDVIIYLDQRGEGSRYGEPSMPKDLAECDAPVLVFRPDLEARNRVMTLTGGDWDEFRGNIRTALAEALGTLRRQPPRRIHLAGFAQLGLAYLIGHHFERNTETELHCVGRREDVFTNEGQPRIGSLAGGNPHCETSHAKIPPLPEKGDLEAISLLLCKIDERFIDDSLRHIATTPKAPPPILIKHEDLLTDSPQVMKYIADVVALLKRLRSERRVAEVHLYTSLPFHAIPLLAANLHFVADRVILMEYRSDLKGQNPPARETYSPLSFQ